MYYKVKKIYKVKDMLRYLELEAKATKYSNYVSALTLFAQELYDNFATEAVIMTKEDFLKTVENLKKVFPLDEEIYENVFLHRFYLAINSVVKIEDLM